MLSFSGVTLFCFVFVFVFLLSLKPPPFVQSLFVISYACAPKATRSYRTTVCVFFFFFDMPLFPSIFVPFISVFSFLWTVRRTPSPSGGCFSTLWPRAGFFTSTFEGIQSINQSIKNNKETTHDDCKKKKNVLPLAPLPTRLLLVKRSPNSSCFRASFPEAKFFSPERQR